MCHGNAATGTNVRRGWDVRPVVVRANARDDVGMEATAQALSAVGLAIGAVEYAVVIRRRARERRRQDEARALAELSALQGLVRVFASN